MPAKRKPAARGREEATDIDLEEEAPKRKKACPPKPRAKKSGSYKMPPPLPRGEELTDFAKHRWRLEESIGKGGFGEIYRAVPVGSTQSADYVIKIVCNIPILLLVFRLMYVHHQNCLLTIGDRGSSWYTRVSGVEGH